VLEFPTRRTLLCLGLVLPALLVGRDAAAESPGPGVEFNRDVRSILSDTCYSCHGPDKNRRKAKLRLDDRASALEHEAIVPGKPDDSELVVRILSDDEDEMMPPPEAHKTLSAHQKDLLKAWIAQGAEYQAHWAYVAPTRQPAPKVQRTDWVRNPIDAFILAMLEAKGVEPSPEAPRRTLIRRLSLDLIGLPPTPDEVRDTSSATRRSRTWSTSATCTRPSSRFAASTTPGSRTSSRASTSASPASSRRASSRS
jgi:hypothetical protein